MSQNASTGMRGETLKIAPNSGVQFLTYGFDIEAAGLQSVLLEPLFGFVGARRRRLLRA